MDSTVLILGIATALLGLVVLALVLRRPSPTSGLSPEQIQGLLRQATMSPEDVARAASQGVLGQFPDLLAKVNEGVQGQLKLTQDSVAKLNQASTGQIAEIVNPLQSRLVEIDQKIAELEKARAAAYTGLTAKVDATESLLKTLGEGTSQLNAALRSNVARGKWGEMQLRKVVEAVHLTEHVDFNEQIQESGDGVGKPDMTVHLHGHRVLYVDAKFPINSYLDSLEAKDEQTSRALREAHAKAVRDHVRKLASRKYDSGEKSLDFVVMFVPIESALVAAFEVMPDLLLDAANQKVVLAGPSSLIAILTNIASSWRDYQQVENSTAILGLMREVASAIRPFVSHLADVGDSLSKTVIRYNKAIGSFDRNVMPKVRRIEETGQLADKVVDLPPVHDEVDLSRYSTDEGNAHSA